MLLDRFRQPIGLADDFQAHIVLVQLRGFALEIMDEIFHQRIHFVLWPVPVLDGKSIERQVFDSELAGGANDDAGGFSAGAMALNARQVTLACPASVSIHDDGNMSWQRGLGLW